MQSPVRMTRALGSDTTPPSAISGHRQDLLGGAQDFKSLMGDMAKMFPYLPPTIQEQARQAHGHIQFLLKHGHVEQAYGLTSHMKEIMAQLVNIPEPMPFSMETQSIVDELPVKESAADPIPSIPPLPSSSSIEVKALQRSVDELRMKLSESSAVTLIAKRVRDMEMEQRFFQLRSHLSEIKRSVADRLDSLRVLTEQAEAIAVRETKKRTVSRNPFCDHEVSGFCEFCVGRDVQEGGFSDAKPDAHGAIRPPVLQGLMKEDLVNKESVIRMQESLKDYQANLNVLLEQKRAQLKNLREQKGLS